MPLHLDLPPRGTLTPNNDVDPLLFYYKPIVGRVFRARIDLGLALLDGPYDALLEVGYGSGLLLPTLAKVAKVVEGLDLEPPPRGLDGFLAARGVRAELVQGDVRAIPLPDARFDCVVAFSIFEHLGGVALDEGLTEVARIMTPGGTFLVGCPAVHRAMSAAFAAIGFSDIDHHHVSDLATILRAADSHFTVEAQAAWPPVVGAALPTGWAPYSAVRLRRR
ncbi:MAG: class I SAM-dependent methyltransferase [Polyangia bacterium]